MGFYNIYRILKDMLRTVFGNKILKTIIIILLFFIILTIKEKCFAITTFDPNFQYNGLTFNINNKSSWSSGINSSPFTGDMDKMAIFRTKHKYRGEIYCNYLVVRCSYPLYLTDVNYSSSPLCKIYSKNNGVNTWMKTASTTEPDYTTNIRLGNNFDNVQYDSLRGAIASFGETLVNPNNPIEVFYSNVDIYLNDELIYQDYTNPSLGNTQEQLENLSFSNFIINANSYTQDIENNDGTLFLLFYNRSLSNPSTTDSLYPIKEKGFTKGSIYTDYENSTSENMIFKFPLFMSGVYFNVGSTYEIRFAKKVYNSEYNTDFYQYLGDPIKFTVSRDVTQDYINQLNQQTATSTDSETTQELQSSIDNQTNAINNQTQSIDNINGSITNSNVENSSIDLPKDNTNNPTQSGIDNIFQTIYNGFTSGTPQDIVFPLPYSNNNITIQPNYVSQMLNSSERRKNGLLSYSSILLVCNK